MTSLRYKHDERKYIVQCGFKQRLFAKAFFESRSKWTNRQEISYEKIWHFLPFFLALYVNLENEK